MAWVDDETDLFVSYFSYSLTPTGGGGIVDEPRTETADRVARYQAD